MVALREYFGGGLVGSEYGSEVYDVPTCVGSSGVETFAFSCFCPLCLLPVLWMPLSSLSREDAWNDDGCMMISSFLRNEGTLKWQQKTWGDTVRRERRERYTRNNKYCLKNTTCVKIARVLMGMLCSLLTS